MNNHLPHTAALSASNRISMNELKELLRSNLMALWASDGILADAPAMIPPVMIWGAPGLGKSTVVRELAQELKVGFIDVRLAQREPVDMRGLPVPDQDSVKWLVSSEWPRDPESRGIIMFDELTAADRTLQVASYEFILDRRLGDLYRVPRGWYILAAGNRIEDRAVACAMSSALANRFLHVEVKPDVESFIEWAVAKHLHPAVVNFIRYRPALLFSQQDIDLQRGWPSPRSWERVSTMLKIADATGRRAMLSYAIPGLVGEGAAAEFTAFYKNMFSLQSNADLREMLITGEEIPIPKRPDLIYACCSAICYHLEVETDDDNLAKMARSFLNFSLRLESDYAMMMINDVLANFKKRGRLELITKDPLYSAWLKRHGARRS